MFGYQDELHELIAGVGRDDDSNEVPVVGN